MVEKQDSPRFIKTDNRTYDTVCEMFVKEDNYEELEGFDFAHLSAHQVAWLIAGLCTIVSITMSILLIYRHFKYYRRPEQQRHIIRILLMVPIYCFCSFLSLRFVHRAVYFDAVRSCYEAFVIYSFYALLLNYLGPNHESQKAALQKKPDGRYPFPFNCIFYNPRSGGFLKACTRGTLQYALIHPITSFIAVALESTDVLCAENYGTNHPQFYLLFIEMVSVMVAMYFLVFFYSVVREDIAKYKPIMKFVAVKFVLFFSFWQMVFLSMMSSSGLIRETEYFSVSQISSQVQNFLICIEMVIACFMHVKCFQAKDYEGYRTNVARGFRDVMIPTDLLADTKNAMKMKRKQKGRGGADAGQGLELNTMKTSTTSTVKGSTMSSPNQQASSGQKLKSNATSPSRHQKETSETHMLRQDSSSELEELSLIQNTGHHQDGDLGGGRRDSVDTNPDMAEDEMDEELDGIGIIRLNPRLGSNDDLV